MFAGDLHPRRQVNEHGGTVEINQERGTLVQSARQSCKLNYTTLYEFKITLLFSIGLIVNNYLPRSDQHGVNDECQIF